MQEYDQIAEWYAADRTHPRGIPEVAALASSISPRSRVLDIGCGNGFPITRALLDAGHRVFGIDSSPQMLTRFRANLPSTAAIRGLVQACAFQDDAFDAAVAWGVIFHLTRAEQETAFAGVSRVLKPGSPFLFTAGDVDDVDGFIEGTMNGVVFRYYSYDVEGYREVLRRSGLTLIDVTRDRGENIYYLARKS